MATMKMNKKSARQVHRDVALQIVAIVVSLVYLVLAVLDDFHLAEGVYAGLHQSAAVASQPPLSGKTTLKR